MLHLGVTPVTAVSLVSGRRLSLLLKNLMNPPIMLRPCSTRAMASMRLAVAVFLGSPLASLKLIIRGTSTDEGRFSTVVLVLTLLMF